MIRVGFPLIGGRQWMGGYNYLVNLAQALCEYQKDRIQPVIFLAHDTPEELLKPLRSIPGIELVFSRVFDGNQSRRHLVAAVIGGSAGAIAEVMHTNRVDVVFESARFFGWRFPIPCIAWFPDFQHRHLKHLFSPAAYWKRDIGFRMQIASGRAVMLSSEDSRRDCESFYPASRGRTHVVRFAVPQPTIAPTDTAGAVLERFDLPEHFFFLPNQFWKHKNHECVIDALRLLKVEGVSLVVAASGNPADPRDPQHYPRLQKRIAEAGLQREFRILGMIPRADVLALMRYCSALINPSLFEGWSTTVEEARAMGTPLMLSSLGVHREQAGDAAAYFDPRSPQELAALLKDFRSLAAAERTEAYMRSREASVARMKSFSADFCALASAAASLRSNV